LNIDNKSENSDWLAWCGIALIISFFISSYIVGMLNQLIVNSGISDYWKVINSALLPSLFMIGSVLSVAYFFRSFKSLIKIFSFRNWKYLYIPEVIGIHILVFLSMIPVSFFTSYVMDITKLFFPESVNLIIKTSNSLKIFILTSNWISFAIFAFFAVVIASFVEEIVFRGVIFSCFKKYTGESSAMFLASLVFAGIHFNFVQFLPLFLLGLVCQKLYLHHKSIYPGILYHALNNSVAMIFLFIIKLFNMEINI